ncbi:uncharacterized protein N7469_002047 [Penicillium citrinum]|uniref:Uncharacterized protein n=1 Tax=Penicillium citrinum TaxID=5077 RepID=A0A9W9TT70_PENCI|nr:uncharacterized protein N7469_002047 [Penicillium citrinum]KAJ5240456.1 hypothetical protein N7469_002047 [Penicillium citrinum]
MLIPDSLVRSPSPSSPTLNRYSPPALTSRPYHPTRQHHQHASTPPTHRRNSASPYFRTKSAATTSQQTRVFTPMDHFAFQPPSRLATPLSTMTQCSNSQFVEVNVHSRRPVAAEGLDSTNHRSVNVVDEVKRRPSIGSSK